MILAFATGFASGHNLFLVVDSVTSVTRGVINDMELYTILPSLK